MPKTIISGLQLAHWLIDEANDTIPALQTIAIVGEYDTIDDVIKAAIESASKESYKHRQLARNCMIQVEELGNMQHKPVYLFEELVSRMKIHKSQSEHYANIEGVLRNKYKIGEDTEATYYKKQPTTRLLLLAAEARLEDI